MKVLFGNDWESGFLDYSMGDSDIRVRVFVWGSIEKIEGQYLEYSYSDWRRVVNYTWEIGVFATFRKVFSRLREKKRNRKWLSVGLGEVVASGSDSFSESGQLVAFLAPNHPKCADQIALNEKMVFEWEGEKSRHESQEVSFIDQNEAPSVSEEIKQYAGWSPESGWPVDEATLRQEMQEIAEKLECTDSVSRYLEARSRNQEVRERAGKISSTSQFSASLFGLGNYAKTHLIPSLPGEIQIDYIHDIDPIQIGSPEDWKSIVDTAGEARADEDTDIHFIAGYHHTHTPLAIEALHDGAYAVVEKPICTNRRQLEELKKVVGEVGNFYSCFHKRYSKLNEWAFQDLDVCVGERINYYAIVYEIKLPPLHWYNWPSSKSRIVSNGCHWIDHFLYVNGYPSVREFTLKEAVNGDINVTVELENDAFFSMVITDKGSSRLGVRDHVELRSGGITAHLVDNSRYWAEDDKRVMRKKSTNRMGSYDRMYSEIGESIVNGGEGDNIETLKSTELIVDIEEELQRRRGGQ